ncbi:hypothetical protein TCAL_01328 [Tigriopus californicus]|uniref:6-phosphofructo-2-kinase domain-containing protein n=1 Tax=Tigriopus californicus TaxID=6832 RepID=A0A553P9X6_TIGCA|nr:6-phosphofructo-2-kinase/fructose-2,6-bisphosphatase-like isoform X2 [Tigriopus californicus]TRY74480.1 hypothetical protein TCAL_01328 [Tigriopus californicus]|eukprot:TCALIF_01328-PA protein Name:"Similar to 6-phosphofructo-2-kinase/fructose-2,6-bisphosphatase (Lithobates catesbeiana)" AED:0.12 eAED:0.12 QI:472/1/1/1/1/1/7/206/556
MYRETRCTTCSNGSRSKQPLIHQSTLPVSHDANHFSRSQSDATANNTYFLRKRKYSVVKFGYHVAIPLARSTPGGNTDGSSPGTSSSPGTPHVIALVGLPARGKTYISKKLSRYLNWIGINTRVFNLGEYRRKMVPQYVSHELFNPSNEDGIKLREQVCQDAAVDVVKWFQNEEGEVAVFDATNTTRKRRQYLYEFFVEKHGCNLFFVESVCDKEDIIENNIKEVKTTSPDYMACNEAEVLNDFKARIKHYQEQYETLDEALEPDISFLKIFNAGEKVLVHKHVGHIQSRIVYYLMNVHIKKRTIYLVRHGESEFNVQGRIGGDSDLSENGIEFARQLALFVNALQKPKMKVWTSWMARAIQTTKYINGVQERWKALNEIDSGACDGMTYAEIQEKFPEDFKERDWDKFSYRYHRGESYEDLIARLEPVIMELERQETVFVVAHQAVIRCLLGYYLETSEEELPWLDVPLHTVVKLEPVAYGCKVQHIRFPVGCVSTYRQKPETPGQLEGKYVENTPVVEALRHSPIKDIDSLMLKLEIREHTTIKPEDTAVKNGC